MRMEDCVKDVAMRDEATIHLIVELDLSANGPWIGETTWSVQKIMGVPIPHVKMSHRGHARKTAAKLLEYVDYCR